MFTKEQQEVINKFPIFIPEPVRTNYFRNVFALKPDAIAFLKSNAVKSKDFIDKSFNWGLTSEGHVYWSKINVIYHRVSNLLDEPGISKQFINAGIPVELASPKANVTYSVTEPLIVATKTCVYPLSGFTIMNDYLLNSQGEIKDDAGIWRSLTSDEKANFIHSTETKIEKYKAPDIPIVRKSIEELREYIYDFDKNKPDFLVPPKEPNRTSIKTDKADYDGPTKIFSGKKRKSKFSPTNNIS